jgi:hypothetical protein
MGRGNTSLKLDTHRGDYGGRIDVDKGGGKVDCRVPSMASPDQIGPGDHIARGSGKEGGD